MVFDEVYFKHCILRINFVSWGLLKQGGKAIPNFSSLLIFNLQFGQLLNVVLLRK